MIKVVSKILWRIGGEQIRLTLAGADQGAQHRFLIFEILTGCFKINRLCARFPLAAQPRVML